MSTDVTDAELAACADVLRRLQPSDLDGDAESMRELRAAGLTLFRRPVLHERHGEQDVVEFLKEQAGYRTMLGKLERLQKRIDAEHEKRRQQAASSGINKIREERLAAIEQSASAAAGADVLRIGLSAGDGDEDEAAASTPPTAETSEPPPIGSFRRYCNTCKVPFDDAHHFYHALCPPCADLNWSKRQQSADMAGKICVVTGGRVRIGYETVLKLLRAGAFVVATTRYPADAALRYSREADFGSWRERLEVCGPLQLSSLAQVEAFCDALLHRFPRIHVLVNNAAQTLTRAAGWHVRMAALEETAAAQLPEAARAMLTAGAASTPWLLRDGSGGGGGDGDGGTGAAGGGEAVGDGTASDEAVAAFRAAALQSVSEADFPRGRLDESLQPLDLSPENSWSRRLGDVPTAELLHTLAANAAAPFVMCSKLLAAIAPGAEDAAWGHIVNVSALEGKFSVGKKGAGHPHTNMAKAALNMLTHTSAGALLRRRVLMNCVDTGWITDMAPGGVGARAATHQTHVGPPLDEEDGAARVLDPVFTHVADPDGCRPHGKFFKDYHPAPW